MTELDAIIARVRASADLPDLLDACFDAFEVIRLAARAGEDRAPGLLAAFMAAAGSAVEGRNALNHAAALPPARGGPPLPPVVTFTGDAGLLADDLARAALLLAQSLTEAATRADMTGDGAACEHAACAAAVIHRLLAGDIDETAIR